MSEKRKPETEGRNPWLLTIVKVIFTALGLGALTVWILQLIHHWRERQTVSSSEPIDFKPSHQGLSTSEVKARQTDAIQQARILAENQTRKARWRRNTFTVFNVTIIVLAISQVLLKDPLGALGTIGTLVLSVSVNIFQETRAAKRVEALASQARPMAAVIRDGRLLSIDQDELVVDDVMVAGKGDEILADGILLESANLIINESKIVEGSESTEKKPGDALVAGSYCEAGWVIYQVSVLNTHDSDYKNSAKLGVTIREKTPLQKIIERVLYVLLVIVGIFYFYLFLEVIRIELFSPELLATYREVMSVIFSILPSGLLLMIVINYAVGSADIARSDVLVHNSQTIESLAQVSTVGFIRHGGAMGLTVALDMLPISVEDLQISERRIRQALGNYAHSIKGAQYPLAIIKEHLDGEPRAVYQQARYLSLYGWEAMTFSSADMPGSFVIGYPEALAPYYQPVEPPDLTATMDEPAKNKSGRFMGKMRKWFNRDKTAKHNLNEKVIADSKNLEPSQNLAEANNDKEIQSGEGGVIKGVRRRLSGLFKRKTKDEQITQEEGAESITQLLFAYSPIKQTLYEDTRSITHYPQCPQGLIPLCTINFIDEVRPEIVKAAKIFKDENISIKLLTGEDPANTLTLAHQLGIIEAITPDAAFTLGEDIVQFSQTELQNDVKEKTVFARLESDQMVQIIQALQAQGEHVAVLGTSSSDLPIMQSANLSITRKDSSPTLLDQADLIVIKNSLNALPDAMQKGQRIVNSVLDVLKLNLTRIAYTLILLVAMYITGTRVFYFHPVQGGMISFFTIILPSVALSLWSSAKRVEAKNMSRLLFHFLVPAAGVTSLAVLVVDIMFKAFGANIIYAQLAVTHTLVLLGLVTFIFVQPPLRILAAGDDFCGRWEPTLAALAFYIIFHVLTLIPLAQRLLRLAPLESFQDYLLILLVTIFWAVLVMSIWHMIWPERFQRGVQKTDDEGFEVVNQS
jgi:magnesium-transporting ATPase (P-type)